MAWLTVLTGILKKIAAPLLMKLGEKVIDNIGSSPSLKTADKATDIEELSNSLNELREFVVSESRPVFEEVNQSIVDYVEDALLTIEDKSDLLAKYSISTKLTMERLRLVQRGLDDFRNDRLYRRISLDDSRCRSILMLPPGEKKQADMAEFAQNVILEILTEQAEILQDKLGGLYTDMERQILRSVQNLEVTAQKYRELVASVDAKDEEKYENLLSAALTKAKAAQIIADFAANGRA